MSIASQLSFSKAQAIVGGATGSLPYQAATSSTAFITIGTNGYVLTSNGTTATWSAASALTVANATNAANIATIARTTAASHYLTFVDSNNAASANELLYTTASIIVDPGTGSLAVGTTPVGTARLSVSQTYATATAAESFPFYITGNYNIADTSLKQVIRTNYGGNHTSGTQANGINVLALHSVGGVGGVTTNAINYWSRMDNSTGATVTNAYNIWIENGAGSGGPTNLYGLYISPLTKGTNNFAVYTQGSTPSYFGGAVTVGGNLTVQGTTTIVDSTVTNIADPIITLGGGANNAAPTADDNKDRGIAFKWHNGTTAKTGFFGYDDSTGYLTFVPDATITNEVISGTKGAADIHLAGGTAMSLHYQSAADTTAFLAAGTAGYLLQTNGVGSAPTWVAASGVSAGSANQVSTILQTGNASYFPTFVDSNNSVSTGETVYTTSSFVINPQTGSVRIGSSTSPSYKLQITNTLVGTQADKTIFHIDDLYNNGANGQYFKIMGGAAGINLLSGWGNLSLGARTNDGNDTFTSYLTVNGATGNIGINVASPSYTLDVNSTTNAIIRAYGTTIGRLSLQNSSRHYSMSVQGSNFLVYDETGSATRATLDSTGNLGVGASPDTYARLTVSATHAGTNPTASTNTSRINIINPSTAVSGNGSAITFQSGSGTNPLYASVVGWMQGAAAGGAYGDLVFATKPDYTTVSPVERMRITYLGNVGIGTITPTHKVTISTSTNSATTTASSIALHLYNIATDGNASQPDKVGIGFGQSTTRAAIVAGTYGNDYIDFFTNGDITTPKVRMRASGAIAFSGTDTYGTSGYVLKSNGDAAPTWVAAGGISAGSAGQTNTILTTTNATYYTTFVDSNNAASGAESFYTTSSFAINPATGVVNLGSANVSGTVTATSVVVTGSGGDITGANNITATGLITGGSFLSTATTAANSTNTGALQVRGGAGIAGGLVVGGIVTATNFSGSLFGGTAMSIHYQSAPNTTAFLAAGTAGYVLQTNGTGAAPSWSPISGITAGTSTQVNTILQASNATYYPTFVDSNNASATAETVYTTSSFTVNAATGVVSLASTTASASSTTGALTVAGGAGIRGDMYVGGDIYSRGVKVVGLNIQEFTATASQTTFTVTGGYTVGTAQIFANGIQLGSGAFVASNGTTVVLNNARNAGDIIRVISGGASTQANNIQSYSLAMSVALGA